MHFICARRHLDDIREGEIDGQRAGGPRRAGRRTQKRGVSASSARRVSPGDAAEKRSASDAGNVIVTMAHIQRSARRRVKLKDGCENGYVGIVNDVTRSKTHA